MIAQPRQCASIFGEHSANIVMMNEMSATEIEAQLCQIRTESGKRIITLHMKDGGQIYGEFVDVKNDILTLEEDEEPFTVRIHKIYSLSYRNATRECDLVEVVG